MANAYVTGFGLLALLLTGHISARTPDRLPELRKKADTLFASRQYQAAIPYYQKLHLIQPETEEWSYRLGVSLILGEGKKGAATAIDLLRESVKSYEAYRPESREMALRYFYLALSYQFHGNLNSAMGYYERAGEKDPDMWKALYNRKILMYQTSTR